MVHDRIKRLRERLQAREEAKKRARREKRQRIQRGDPETKTEAARVKARRAREKAQGAKREVTETKSEAQGLASDAKSLIATELGVSRSESESIIKQGADLIRDAGDSLNDLDLDGDGDTDILSMIDGDASQGDRGGALGPVDPDLEGGDVTEPVMDPLNEPDDGLDDLI